MEVIITADWHIRASTPISRIEENWWKEVVKPKIQFILDFDLPIWHAGDFFDSPNFISLPIINELKDMLAWANITVIPGNHDLFGYEFTGRKSTAFYNLFGDDWLPCNFEIEGAVTMNTDFSGVGDTENIFFYHGPVFEKEVPFYMEHGITAKELMNKYPGYKIFITGDNHSPFIYKEKDRILINPGSLCRLSKAQKNFRPRIYILNTETLEYEINYIPIKEDVWKEEEEDIEYDFSEISDALRKEIEDGLDFNEIMIKLLKDQNENIKRRISTWI